MAEAVKTNVMRILEREGVTYRVHTYSPETGIDGVSVARALGQDPQAVFKTLVTQGKSRAMFVFVIPVAATLNLKRAAGASELRPAAVVGQRRDAPGGLAQHAHDVRRARLVPVKLLRLHGRGAKVKAAGGRHAVGFYEREAAVVHQQTHEFRRGKRIRFPMQKLREPVALESCSQAFAHRVVHRRRRLEVLPHKLRAVRREELSAQLLIPTRGEPSPLARRRLNTAAVFVYY